MYGVILPINLDKRQLARVKNYAKESVSNYAFSVKQNSIVFYCQMSVSLTSPFIDKVGTDQVHKFLYFLAAMI